MWVMAYIAQNAIVFCDMYLRAEVFNARHNNWTLDRLSESQLNQPTSLVTLSVTTNQTVRCLILIVNLCISKTIEMK